MLPPMISYAQNAEDVVLRRALQDVERGFYVDIGACVPVLDSVTHHFYEAGWSGVNVEPDPRFHAELAAARPRDVNLQAAVGAGGDPLTFFPTTVRGQGTVDAELGRQRGEQEPVEVEQVTLAEVFRRHVPQGQVDFLKVDVEGWEEAVLASADWASVRPRIVVVEAVDAAGRPTHEHWEPALLAADYRPALFDGLNRFYCRAEDEDELLPRLTAPANVLDNWRQGREVDQQRLLLQRLDQADAAAAARAAELQAALDAERVAHAAARQWSATLEQALTEERSARAEAERSLAAEQAARSSAEQASRRVEAQLRQAVEALERSLAAEREELGAVRRELEGVMASTSWRVTMPLRDASRLAKVMRRGPVR